MLSLIYHHFYKFMLLFLKCEPLYLPVILNQSDVKTVRVAKYTSTVTWSKYLACKADS